jgi:hypothetical protein
MGSRKTLKFIIVFLLIISWLFTGFPQIWQNPRIPPEIEEAQAASPIPTYVGSGTFTIGTGAITPPFPSGTQANDVCLLVAESENQAISLSSAQGFAELPSSPQYAGTAATSPANRIAVFWKRLVGGDTAPTVADSGDHTSGQIHCFRGVTGVGNPWDVTVGGNDGGANDTSGVIPGSTTTVANTLVVLIQGTSYDGNSTAQCSGWTNASLANLTERTDNTKNTGLGGGHCMATGEKATAGAYSDTTVTLANTTYKGAISVALKPPAPTFNQSAYRLFNNLDSTDVGTALAAQDTAATLGSTGAAFRLRMLLHIGTDYLPVSGESFKLQFAQRGSDNQCDTSFSGETYADVTTTTVIAYNDNPTPADGAALTANSNDPTHGTDTIVNQTYEELNNFTNSQAAIPSGQDGKWDFSLKDNGASASTAYCFRVVKSDGSLLDTYTVIPQITTAAAPTLTLIVDAGATINFGSITPGTRKTATTRLKVDTNSTSGYQVSVGRKRASPAATLASSANPSIYISDTAGGIDVFDGLGANCTDGTGPAVWISGSSTGLGFTLWAADISKETTCWGSGSSETDSLNKYAALQASVSASNFLVTSSNVPNPSYASVGWSIDVSNLQQMTDYTGDVIFSATTNPP